MLRFTFFMFNLIFEENAFRAILENYTPMSKILVQLNRKCLWFLIHFLKYTKTFF